MSKKSWLAWASTRRRLLQNTVNPVKPCSFYSQDETLNLVWSQKYDLTRSLIVGPPPSLAGWKACSAVRCRQGAFLCCAWLGTPSPTAPCGLLSISISPYFIIISFYLYISVLFPFWSSLYFYCYWLLLLVFQLQLHPGWCYWRQGIRGQGQSEHCELCELWNGISWNNFSMSPAPADAAQERSLERVTQMHLGREKTQSQQSLGFFSIKKGNSVI